MSLRYATITFKMNQSVQKMNYQINLNVGASGR